MHRFGEGDQLEQMRKANERTLAKALAKTAKGQNKSKPGAAARIPASKREQSENKAGQPDDDMYQ